MSFEPTSSPPPSSSPKASTAYLLLRRSFAFFSGTLLSRLSGMFRDIAMAYSFGASDAVSLFMVAFRFSNLPRRLFGEGALQSIVIARYEALRLPKTIKKEQNIIAQENEKEENEPHITEDVVRFYLDSTASWSILLFGLILFVFYPLTFLFDALYQNSPHVLKIIYYCKLMLPGLWFICMSAQNDAAIKSMRRFLFVSSAPAIFNSAWIALALLLAPYDHQEALPTLAMGIVIAFALQWSASFLRARSLLLPPKGARPKTTLFSRGVVSLFKPLGMGIIGVGALQINSLLDALFALTSEIAGPSYLWYAIRIEQAPLSLIGIAIASASLPSLASALKQGDQAQAKKLFSLSENYLQSAMFLVASALFALGLPSLRLILERGEFTSYQSLRTAQCLWAYIVGLTPQCLIFIYQNALFSLHGVSAVTRASLWSVLLNLVLNTLFVFLFDLSAYSVALATSMAAVLQLFLAKRYLAKKAPFLKTPFSPIKLLQEALLLLASFGFGLWAQSQVYQLPISDFLRLEPFAFLPTSSLLQKAIDLVKIFFLWLLFYFAMIPLLQLPLPYLPSSKK